MLPTVTRAVCLVPSVATISAVVPAAVLVPIFTRDPAIVTNAAVSQPTVAVHFQVGPACKSAIACSPSWPPKSGLPAKGMCLNTGTPC